ncbi:MAG: transglycosylase SLT domain-containing protein [Myxococcota bacterium]
MTHRTTTLVSLTSLLLMWAAQTVHASPDLPMCVASYRGLTEPALSTSGPWAPTMCGPHFAPIAAVEPTPLSERAVEAYRSASALIADTRYEEARLELDLAGEGLPRVRDRIALRKAQLELLRGRDDQAAVFFAEAAASSQQSVRLRASVGYTLAALRADDPDAERLLEDLLWTYPAIPGHTALRYEHAQALLRQGRVDEGAAVLHGLRVQHPGSPYGPRAGAEIERLREAGTPVPLLTDEDRVEIVRRLVRTGPLDRAKAEASALVTRLLDPEQQAQAQYLAGKLARYEGRWQAAATYLRAAQALSISDPPTARHIENRADDMAETAAARHQATARAETERVRAGRALAAVPGAKLVEMIEVASPAGLQDTVDDILVTLAARDNAPAATLFDAAMAAVGTGSEGLIIVILDRLVTRGPARYRTAAHYHLARAHERAGRPAEALQRYAETTLLGDPYYALWANNGVQRLQQQAPTERPEGFLKPEEQNFVREPQDPDADLADELDTLATRHGSAYPWLGRAADLLRVGEHEAATEELFHAYLGWRDALGRSVARAGLDSVARASARTAPALEPDVRDARLALTDGDRATLAGIAHELGDCGTAAGFAGSTYLETLPRAYEWLVVPAANRYGLDPNLLLAVMRVESAYQKHIVSYAGAVGLMQIMPRTGQLIAHAVDHEDFSPADLLDPKTNLEFAAWYLTSLLRRFDGRLPLAIAAYNGGPHNVRRWMAQSPPDAPVDALLERIPFTQTHRYVRRVLVHYEAYRQQQELPTPLLSTKLPEPRVDPLSF